MMCIVAAKWSEKWKTEQSHVYANISFLEQDIFPYIIRKSSATNSTFF